MPQPANLYRVRPGFTFGTFDEVKPGGLVTLTANEAAGFLDKLEFVQALPPETPPVHSPARSIPVLESKPRRKQGHG